jgi:hypothetical protein
MASLYEADVAARRRRSQFQERAAVLALTRAADAAGVVGVDKGGHKRLI